MFRRFFICLWMKNNINFLIVNKDIVITTQIGFLIGLGFIFNCRIILYLLYYLVSISHLICHIKFKLIEDLLMIINNLHWLAQQTRLAYNKLSNVVQKRPWVVTCHVSLKGINNCCETANKFLFLSSFVCDILNLVQQIIAIFKNIIAKSKIFVAKFLSFLYKILSLSRHYHGIEGKNRSYLTTHCSRCY